MWRNVWHERSNAHSITVYKLIIMVLCIYVATNDQYAEKNIKRTYLIHAIRKGAQYAVRSIPLLGIFFVSIRNLRFKEHVIPMQSIQRSIWLYACVHIIYCNCHSFIEVLRVCPLHRNAVLSIQLICCNEAFKGDNLKGPLWEWLVLGKNQY